MGICEKTKGVLDYNTTQHSQCSILQVRSKYSIPNCYSTQIYPRDLDVGKLIEFRRGIGLIREGRDKTKEALHSWRVGSGKVKFEQTMSVVVIGKLGQKLSAPISDHFSLFSFCQLSDFIMSFMPDGCFACLKPSKDSFQRQKRRATTLSFYGIEFYYSWPSLQLFNYGRS